MNETDMLFEIVDYVREFFEKTPEKAVFWFETPNPMLGEIKPIDMIRHGRIKILWQFVRNAQAGNFA